MQHSRSALNKREIRFISFRNAALLPHVHEPEGTQRRAGSVCPGQEVRAPPGSLSTIWMTDLSWIPYSDSRPESSICLVVKISRRSSKVSPEFPGIFSAIFFLSCRTVMEFISSSECPTSTVIFSPFRPLIMSWYIFPILSGAGATLLPRLCVCVCVKPVFICVYTCICHTHTLSLSPL